MNPEKNTPVTFPKNKPGVKPWIYFLSAVFIILILSPLFQKGCFLDGLLYKTVAYNYAEDLSTFWQMKFTNTSMYEFCEQPPLYFFMLGNFYKVFGIHDLTDRLFTLLLFILLIVIFNATLRSLFRHSLPYLLLVIFFLLAIPVFCWSYVNQILEPLVCVLTAGAILCFVRFLHSGKWIFIPGFVAILFLLFLTKGFQSCFIIALPVFYTLLSGLKKSTLYFSLASGLIFLCGLAVCLKFFASAGRWFTCYYESRLVLTMQNVGGTTDNHFEIIGRFFSELLVCLGMMIFGAGLLKIRKKYPLLFVLKNFLSNRLAVALLLTAFAGSFPYALSLVQRGFYLIPAFICFVLAVVYGFKRYLAFLLLFFTRAGELKIVRIASILILIGSLVYFCLSYQDYKRNKELFSDLELILPYFKKGETVLIDEDRWNDFSLHACTYMNREVSLSTDKRKSYFLIRSKTQGYQKNDSLYKIDLETREIDLYLVLKWRQAGVINYNDLKNLGRNNHH